MNDALFTAMCVWEWALEQPTRSGVNMFRENFGACETRRVLINLVPHIEDAYELLEGRCYAVTYDWDFVPFFMDRCVLWGPHGSIPYLHPNYL